MAANRGIQSILDAWSGDLTTHLGKLPIAKRSWDDAVFGNLIREWLDIFDKAYKENRRVTEVMSTMRLGSQEWDDACDKFESYCEVIYEEVLESGFRHLEGVREFPDWNKLVATNVRMT